MPNVPCLEAVGHYPCTCICRRLFDETTLVERTIDFGGCLSVTNVDAHAGLLPYPRIPSNVVEALLFRVPLRIYSQHCGMATATIVLMKKKIKYRWAEARASCGYPL